MKEQEQLGAVTLLVEIDNVPKQKTCLYRQYLTVVCQNVYSKTEFRPMGALIRVKFGMDELTFGRLLHVKFQPLWYTESPLWAKTSKLLKVTSMLVYALRASCR